VTLAITDVRMAPSVVNPVDWDMKNEQGVCYLAIDVEYYLSELDL